MYSIDQLCPKGGMGGCGFLIHLAPEFREAVKASGLDQEKVDRTITTYGLEWLQKCGFSSYFDPENCGFEKKAYATPSDDTRPSYSHRHIRVTWGEWGPEHISVPGNACGLDVDKSIGCVFEGGKILVPHNVDSLNQVMLLLIVFSWFAHSVILLGRK